MTETTPAPEQVAAPLGVADAGELLTLQRAAYATEAQLYGDPSLPALTQTLDELVDELRSVSALGIRAGGRLIGAVRWRVDGDVAEIGRLVIAPDQQGRGLGTRLLRAAEEASGARTFELFTGHLSVANIRLYEREGYAKSRREALRDGVELVFLRKSAAS
ncbi:GNAT family N-acetyltransferase [Schumannella luteola]|uniref:Ribosomal protein S18 acetylase RimI-like enzyme n=1 Tax=Schumannella luteola TaxID=472059 RepID=A0A852YQB6_9MICO|nr:GNAT family N-acetyltransferase [Schumannella luteola]NYG99405.1 ribosomal protein S18 acetylase RimI-like enzyme [Schumannella luteola]TPX06127.1 GNAT family N-acetyltransferase [Schumannella luteola]